MSGLITDEMLRKAVDAYLANDYQVSAAIEAVAPLIVERCRAAVKESLKQPMQDDEWWDGYRGAVKDCDTTLRSLLETPDA